MHEFNLKVRDNLGVQLKLEQFEDKKIECDLHTLKVLASKS
jgi:hypothetical protein